MKLGEKRRALYLRKRGMAYNKILKTVGVSKSTLSLWLRDVVLTNNAKERILKRGELSRHIAAQRRKQEREKRIEEFVQRGQSEFRELLKAPLFLAGLCLYWAEGDKHKQEKVKFTNSDGKMIAFMMRWFREVCEVPEKKFRIALHVYNLQIAKNVKQYWARVTGVPESQFHKMYIKKTSLRHRKNVLYNGTCAIVINNKELFRKIRGWKLGLLGYFCIPS